MMTLWHFLLQLLFNKNYKDVICWLSRDGEFKILKPDELARLWGLSRSKTNMTFYNLSRSLNYYYKKDIITNVPGRMFVYKFKAFPRFLGPDCDMLESDCGCDGDEFMMTDTESEDETNQHLGYEVFPSFIASSTQDSFHPHRTINTGPGSDLYDRSFSGIQIGANPGCSSFSNTPFPSLNETSQFCARPPWRSRSDPRGFRKRGPRKTAKPQNEEPAGPSLLPPGSDIVSAALKSAELPSGSTLAPIFITTETPPRLLVISSHLFSDAQLWNSASQTGFLWPPQLQILDPLFQPEGDKRVRLNIDANSHSFPNEPTHPSITTSVSAPPPLLPTSTCSCQERAGSSWTRAEPAPLHLL